MTEHGIYLVDDLYFADFPSGTWMQNKSSTRPHYYVFKDSSGLPWMIPMSSKTEKYKRKISDLEAVHGKGKCAFYHIGFVNGRESAFIISGMFPVTSKYILRSYDMQEQPVIIKNATLNADIRRKAVRYIKLLEQGKLKDMNNVLSIRQSLLQQK